MSRGRSKKRDPVDSTWLQQKILPQSDWFVMISEAIARYSDSLADLNEKPD